jgi:hypothetical protein
VRPVLKQCNPLLSVLFLFFHLLDISPLVQSHKGIVKALLVTEDGNVASPNDDIDQLGVLANLQALIGLCTDISKCLSLLIFS